MHLYFSGFIAKRRFRVMKSSAMTVGLNSVLELFFSGVLHFLDRLVVFLTVSVLYIFF